MAPVSRKGHQGSALSVYPIDASVVMQAGDIVVVDSITRDMQTPTTDPTGDIFGVAMLSPKAATTTASTIDRDANVGPDINGSHHALNVALALPGQLFAGNIIDTSVANHTGVYVDDLRRQLAVGQSTLGYWCVEDSPTDPVVLTMDYITPQYDSVNGVWAYGRAAGVGVINPRVTFYFIVTATIFGN